MATSVLDGNSFQSPIPGEEGGASWHKVADPATGWLSSKTASWVSDKFSDDSASDCLTVNFLSVVPAGTKAVRIVYFMANGTTFVYWRKAGDTNVSNTPHASGEYSHRAGYGGDQSHSGQLVVWLSSEYKADFAIVGVTTNDLYISYPVEYLL